MNFNYLRKLEKANNKWSHNCFHSLNNFSSVIKETNKEPLFRPGPMALITFPLLCPVASPLPLRPLLHPLWAPCSTLAQKFWFILHLGAETLPHLPPYLKTSAHAPHFFWNFKPTPTCRLNFESHTTFSKETLSHTILMFETVSKSGK